MDPKEADRLKKMAEAETNQYLARQAITFLQCSVNLLAHSFEPEEVAEILEAMADDMRDWG